MSIKFILCDLNKILSVCIIKGYKYDKILQSSYEFETNGLSELPNLKFQLMTLLSFMWSIVFTLMVGSYLMQPTLLLHIFLIGIYFTSEVLEK